MENGGKGRESQKHKINAGKSVPAHRTGGNFSQQKLIKGSLVPLFLYKVISRKMWVLLGSF